MAVTCRTPAAPASIARSAPQQNRPAVPRPTNSGGTPGDAHEQRIDATARDSMRRSPIHRAKLSRTRPVGVVQPRQRRQRHPTMQRSVAARLMSRHERMPHALRQRPCPDHALDVPEAAAWRHNRRCGGGAFQASQARRHGGRDLAVSECSDSAIGGRECRDRYSSVNVSSGSHAVLSGVAPASAMPTHAAGDDAPAAPAVGRRRAARAAVL